MDILGFISGGFNWAIGSVGHAAVSVVALLFGGFVVKKTAQKISDIIAVGVAGWIKRHFSGEVLTVINQVIHYVEGRMPQALGPEKKAKAMAIAKKLLPFLPEQTLSDLIDQAVAASKSTFQTIEANLQ